VGGAGLFPVSPGTAGSLVAVLAGWPLMLLPPWVLPLACVAATVGGWWSVRASGARGDPGWVVIDEVAGMWITMLGLGPGSPTLAGLAVAFVLFRVLDITKPGPISWADRRDGPVGVMLDDVIAGAIGACVLWGVRLAWPGVVG